MVKLGLVSQMPKLAGKSLSKSFAQIHQNLGPHGTMDYYS